MNEQLELFQGLPEQRRPQREFVAGGRRYVRLAVLSSDVWVDTSIFDDTATEKAA